MSTPSPVESLSHPKVPLSSSVPSKRRSASFTERAIHAQKNKIVPASETSKKQRRMSVPASLKSNTTTTAVFYNKTHQTNDQENTKITTRISTTTTTLSVAPSPNLNPAPVLNRILDKLIVEEDTRDPAATTASTTRAISTLPTSSSVTPESDLTAAPRLLIEPVALDAPAVLHTLEDTLASVQRNATKPEYANFSTQKLIRTLMENIKVAGLNPVIPENISSTFVKDASGKVIVEPYVLKVEGKDKTFYKVQAKYTLPVTINGQNKAVEFTRPIYTTATNVETAIFAASQYKEAVIQLAQAPLDNTDYNNPNARVKNYSQIPVDKRSLINDERSLRFHLSYDANGKPKSADYFYAGLQNQAPKIEWGTRPAAQKYVRDVTTMEIKGLLQQDPVPPSLKQILYPSEAEALLDTPYIIPLSTDEESANATYERLEKTPERFAELRAEVEKKEKEIKELQEKFKKKSFFGGPLQDTTEYKELKAGIQALDILKNRIDIPSTLQTLSSHKHQLTSLYRQAEIQLIGSDAKLQELRSNKAKLEAFRPATRQQDLNLADQGDLNTIKAHYPQANLQIANPAQPTDAEINILIQLIDQENTQIESQKQQLKQIEERLGAEQTTFNRHLFKLEALNQELQNVLNELESVNKGAQQKITSIPAPAAGSPSSPELEAAKKIQQDTALSIASLKTKVEANNNFIGTLMRELGLETTDIVVSDNPIVNP